MENGGTHKEVLQPKTALIVIDVQNDFICGSLALKNCPAKQDGVEVIAPINKLLETCRFDLVVYSKDWHPADHISFAENLAQRKVKPGTALSAAPQVGDTVEFDAPYNTSQKLWPTHCVQGTWGSELHKDLKILDNAIIVNKGEKSDVDSYSAFFDNNKQGQTNLMEMLNAHGINTVFVCGVAYDVCASYTALDALSLGLGTVLVEDCCRGVHDEDILCMKQRLQDKGAVLAHSSEVQDLLSGEDRRIELALQVATSFSQKGAIKDHQQTL